MSKAKILIVEDEHIVAMDIQNRLENNGYQVAGHTDRGEKAVELAEELRPDLILMDISLKGEVDGIEAATWIRKRDNIPVIFLTAFADQSTTDRARLAEPYGFLLKPYEEREVIITIEMALYKHHMEIKLAESEARYRRLAINAPDIIFRYEISPEMKLTYINPAVETITGYTPEDCYADPTLMFDMIHPDDKGLMANYMQSSNLPNGALFARWVGKDQVVRWMESRLIPIMDASGQMIAVEGITRDISERKRAEDVLRESENKFRSVIENASDGIALIDAQGHVVEWNQALEQMTGLTRAEVIDQPIWKISFEMLPAEDKKSEASDAQALAWNAAIKNRYADKDQMIEREIETPEGVRRVLQSNGFTLEAPQGVMAGVIMRDITDRKKLELAELDQRRLAEALRDSAMILNSTLKLDDILDRILDNIGMLVEYDTSMVSLLEGGAVHQTRYRHNPHITSSLQPIGVLQVNLITVPILKTVVDTQQPILIPDIQKDVRWEAVAIPGMKRIHSLICAPIEIKGQVVGVINVVSGTPEQFTPLHVKRIMAFSSQAAVAIENAKLYEQARHLSLIDPLTELFNMRYFLDFAGLEFERVKRYARTLSVAMVDIDHFKSINDQYGHSMGDQALREISRRIKASIRAVDVIARYGGEEFIILMPETPLDEALAVAERVRQNAAKNLIESDDFTIAVTISLGVAEMKDDAQSLDELIKSADKALYEAKAKGRNRVEGFQ